MPRKNPYHRSALAAVAVSFLLLLSGWAYRTLAAQVGIPLAKTAIAPNALEAVSMRIADWVGKDVPLDDVMVRRTDTDAHLNRRYVRGSELVSLYIGCGVRTRDLIMHRPDTCYVAAGWTRTGRSFRDLPLSSGATLPCTIFEFSRGDLNIRDKIVVLHYYIVDGQHCQSVSQWRYSFWRIGYVAQVQIAASLETLALGEATRIISQFAADSALQIQERFEHITSERRGASLDESPIGK